MKQNWNNTPYLAQIVAAVKGYEIDGIDDLDGPAFFFGLVYYFFKYFYLWSFFWSYDIICQS